MLSEVEAGLNLWERFRNWLDAKRNPPVESVAARFLRLFESHDVHRNQIPRFFGHGLSLSDVQDDASLLPKLDDTILEAACALFAVRKEWLEGAGSLVYPSYDFYKHPEKVSGFIETLRANNPDGELSGVLLAPDENIGEALVVLQEVIGGIGDKPVYRYHLCNNWLFEYWKSRAYLTAFVAIAWKRGVYIRGISMPQKEIERMTTGEVILSPRVEGDWALSGKKWYPEDMALKPEAYIRGIDPEKNKFGITAGLQLWLDLEQQGYMDTGIQMNEGVSVRKLFQQELARYLRSNDNLMV